jgi:hypothetical protein
MAGQAGTGEDLAHQLQHVRVEDTDGKKASLFRGDVVIASERPSSIDSVTSDNPFFDQELEYTPEEEAKVLRILDRRLFPWILLTTFVLNMDRTNHSNAISDNLPEDLGFSINVVNTATAIYSVLFSIFCLSGAIIAKWAGPARCMRFHLGYDWRLTVPLRDPVTHVFMGLGHCGSRFDPRRGRLFHWCASVMDYDSLTNVILYIIVRSGMHREYYLMPSLELFCSNRSH